MSDDDVAAKTAKAAKKLGVNALPKEGFSLVIDGKFKTHYATADEAQAGALKLKTRFPSLQIMIRDDATGVRTAVELSETVAP